jgi:hypothetical protein
MAKILDLQFDPAQFEIVANLHAVFDESGKQDSEHVIFAGLIALPQRWNQLSAKWNETLRRRGLTYWRTVDAAHRNRQFTRFRHHRTELEKLAILLAELLCEYAASGCVSSITMQEYNLLSPETRNRLKNPFYAAFEFGMRGLTNADGIEPMDIFTFICDDSEEYSSESLRVYRRLRKLNPKMAERISGICFSDDRKFPGLQAADLFAFCYRKRCENSLEGVWREIMKRFDESFPAQTATDITLEKPGDRNDRPPHLY